jgi:integrase
MNSTFKTMTRLMLSTGLRNEECRTFPRKYVMDPNKLDKQKPVKLTLNPRDMLIKGNKPRDIYLSWMMMNRLYQYTRFGEGPERADKYKKQFGVAPPLLFLSEQGQAWSENALTYAFRKLWAGYEKNGYIYPPVISFHVTPHMLRHTYATWTLYSMRKKNGIGHALAYVRDRLGHSSIQTTSIYVHCLDLMDEPELDDYQQDLDRMIAEGSDDEQK